MADFNRKIPIAMPYSGKRKQKYDLFSPSVSCLRLRKVQGLLKANGVDGLLCILGIDSRYNSGTRQLLNYLLFGYCNISADTIRSRLTDEALEDLIVFVKPSSVHIYCNPINYDYLLPYIAHWRNLHLHCLLKDQDDEAYAEEFKIVSFITMVNGCERIGIPYGYDSTQKPFDAFVVEKWPLIQAFALEGFGGGGFFTMAHEVVDVTSWLNDLLGAIDPVKFEQLATERLPLFERHCKSVLSIVDVESGSWDSLSKITEDLVGEPLISYYKHGHMSDNLKSDSDDKDKPFVLFGVNTTRECLDKAKNGILNSRNTTLCTSGSTHMICCARDPRGTLSCIRTYFFGKGFLPCSVGNNADLTKLSSGSKDLKLLIDLYLLVIDAVLDGIKEFVETQDITKAKIAADACVNTGLKKKNLFVDTRKVKFLIEAHDFLGRKVTLENGKYFPSIKVASLFIYDIPSIEKPESILGSIAFGETFLDSIVEMLDNDTTRPWNSQYVIITENISRFTSWQRGQSEKDMTEKIEDLVKANQDSTLLGEQLVHGDVSIYAGLSLYTMRDEGTLYVFDKGFIFDHRKYGSVIIPFHALSKMQFYDKESNSVAALLMLEYQPSMTCHLPSHLVNNGNRIIVTLLPRTKIFRHFYSDVLPLWKSENTTPVLELISEMPEHLLKVYSYIRENDTMSYQDSIQHATKPLTQMKRFVSHINLSSTCNVPVNSQDIGVLLGEPKKVTSAVDSTNLELLITILTGMPGSGKEHLCNTLLALAKENSKWIVLRSPLNSTQPFNAKVLQASLSNTVASQKKLLVRMSSKQVRVILVTSGFTDIVEVVEAIYNHPRPDIKNHIKIGAVTCCIDPNNIFMKERFTLPKVLEQCAQGWVNNIVLTSCLDAQNEKLAMVQKLIRVCNPDAAFILAKGGEVTRSSDVELILSDSAFTNEKAMQKRHLICPGWSLGLFNPGSGEPKIDQICINLFGPLDRNLFVAKLKALQGSLNLNECLTTCTICNIRGHVHFVEHNTITEVHWSRLNGRLSMKTVDVAGIPRPPPKATQNGSVDDPISYFIVFSGFLLQEDILKDWLRSCCKRKPQKKPSRSLKDLTKKELDQIGAKHKCDPLPEGWFYNGTTYVNLTGEKSLQHPLMDNFVKEYLAGVNEDITKYNASLSTLSHVDIFKRY